MAKGTAVGLEKGHIVTKRAVPKGQASRKGVRRPAAGDTHAAAASALDSTLTPPLGRPAAPSPTHSRSASRPA